MVHGCPFYELFNLMFGLKMALGGKGRGVNSFTIFFIFPGSSLRGGLHAKKKRFLFHAAVFHFQISELSRFPGYPSFRMDLDIKRVPNPYGLGGESTASFLRFWTNGANTIFDATSKL